MFGRFSKVSIVSIHLVSCLLLAGCGAGGSSSSSPSSSGTAAAKTTLTGQAIKGPFVGARLQLFGVTSQGRRGHLLATVTTDDSGRFSTPLSLPATGPVWIEAEVSRHRDEDTQQIVSLPVSRVVTYCVPEVRLNRTTDAPLTPFNHMAFRAAMAAGGVSSARVRAALTALSTATGVDVETQRAADLSTREGLRQAAGSAATPASANQLRVGLYLAGMSRRARELGVDAVDYMLELGRDFEDGHLDGLDGQRTVLPGLSTREMDSIHTSVDTYTREHADDLDGHSDQITRIEDTVREIHTDTEPNLDVTHLPDISTASGTDGSEHADENDHREDD